MGRWLQKTALLLSAILVFTLVYIFSDVDPVYRLINMPANQSLPLCRPVYIDSPPKLHAKRTASDDVIRLRNRTLEAAILYNRPPVSNITKTPDLPIIEDMCEDCSSGCHRCEKQRLQFVANYTMYCNTHYTPSVVNTSKPLCKCLPDELVGYEEPDFEMPTMGDIRMQYKDSIVHGSYTPRHCTARQRVALIIPCRDREEHLRVFLNRLNTVLQRQQISYQIFVVEQVSPELFNKASMMNIAFIQARKQEAFDCYIFHDVDMIPENDYNMYTCINNKPRHVGSYLDKFGYILKYLYNFGGVTSFTPELFVKVNGYSNTFFGWGGEDDDMFHRIRTHGMWVDRYPSTIGRYSMIKHKHDLRNPINSKRYRMVYHKNLKSFRRDGLNSIKYELIAIINKPLYKLIYASISAPGDSR